MSLLNVNSIRAPSRLLETQKLFVTCNADIMILTETNHQDDLCISHSALMKLSANSETYKKTRSKLANGKHIGIHYTSPTKYKGNGVVILAKPGFKIYPILEALASNWVTATMVQKFKKDVTNGIYKFIVIGVYWKHGHHA